MLSRLGAPDEQKWSTRRMRYSAILNAVSPEFSTVPKVFSPE